MQKYEYTNSDTGSAVTVSAEDLISMAKAGTINPDTKVRKVGGENWSRAGNTKGLQFAAASDGKEAPKSDSGTTVSDARKDKQNLKRLDQKLWKNLLSGGTDFDIEDFNRFLSFTTKGTTRILFAVVLIQSIFLILAVVNLGEWGFAVLFPALYLFFLSVIMMNAAGLLFVTVRLGVYYLKDIRDSLNKADLG